jgi:hypothetical protein
MRARSTGVLFIVALGGCGGSDPTSITPPPPPDQVVVTSVTPSQIVTGGTANLTIRGSGFDAASTVSFTLADQPASELAVTDSRFVSPTEMSATVNVAGGTPTRRYNVVIRTGRGTRGIGNEKIWNLAFQDLGTGWALGVNSGGMVVGYTAAATGALQEPFVWDPAISAMATLPSPGGAFGGEARDVTDNGLIVGQVDGVPVRWQGASHTPSELFPRTSTGIKIYEGEAMRANESGLIVGYVRAPVGNKSFCWRPDEYRIIEPPDATFTGSGVLWDVNENGDAVGRVVRGTGDDARAEALIVHCHAVDPTITVLPRPAASIAAVSYAIGDDGSVYGNLVDGSVTRVVRWRMTAPDQWQLPEVLDLPFEVRRVTPGGRLVGMSANAAYVWDPGVGTRRLSDADLDGRSMAWGSADAGSGTTLHVVGTSVEATRAVRWPSPLPR